MIGRDTIDRIRARINLFALVGESVKLTRRGRSHVGLCPFHQEKSPSFSVSESFFHCFGCKTSGDCFKFVELTEGLSFAEAVRKLAEKAGVEIEDERSDVDRSAEARARKAKEELYAINNLAAAWFEKMLIEHPLGSYARDELARRGLAYDGECNEVLRSFKVGYAPHGWDGLSNHLRQNGVSPAQAEQLGLLAPRSSGTGYYDAFRHRLMVAILDVQGHVVAFSGRVLADPPDDPSTRAQRDKHGAPPKYVNSRESQIYSKGSTLFGLFQARNAIRAKGEVVIVEGNFDLIAMHARGIDHVVAPMGTAFTDDQARLLRRFASSLVLLFDADAAGRKATWAARATCKAIGLSPRVARMPQGKDPDEFLQAKGPAAMKDVLKAARALDEVLIDDLCEPVGEGTDLGTKQAALEKIRPILEDQELAFRDVLGKRVANRLGLDPNTLWRLIRSAHADVEPGSPRERDERAAREATGRRAERVGGGAPSRSPVDLEQERLSRAIVETLLVCPELLEDPTLQDCLGLVTGDWAFAVVELRGEMRNSRRENRPMDVAAVLAQLPQTIQEAAAAKLADPILETAYTASRTGRDSKKLAAEVLHTSADGRPDPLLARRKIMEDGGKLEKAVTQARYREIQREIDRAESSGDFDRAAALLAEKSRLAMALRTSNDELRNERLN